jgi:hypothetical protein
MPSRSTSNRLVIRLPQWWATLGAIGADPLVHEPYAKAARKAVQLYVDLAVEIETTRLAVHTCHPRLIDNSHPWPGICTTCWDPVRDDHHAWPCPTLRAIGVDADGHQDRDQRPGGYEPRILPPEPA